MLPARQANCRSLTLAVFFSGLVLQQAEHEADAGDTAGSGDTGDAGETRGKWDQLTQRFSLLAQVSDKPLREAPPASLTLRWKVKCATCHKCHCEKNATMYMGPLLGTRFTSDRPANYKEETLITEPVQILKGGSRIDALGAHYFEYYALEFEKENFQASCCHAAKAYGCQEITAKLSKDIKRLAGSRKWFMTIERVVEDFRMETRNVILGFKLPVENLDEAEKVLGDAFKTAVEAVKPSTVENRLELMVQATQKFNDTTETFLAKSGLNRGGVNMIVRISNDGWLLSSPPDWCDESICNTIGLGHYILAVTYLKHHVPLRLRMFAHQLACEMNVTQVVSLNSMRQMFGNIQPYQDSFNGLKVGQYSTSSPSVKFFSTWANPTKSTFGDLKDRLMEAIRQPRSPAPFAVSNRFFESKENAYHSVLHQYICPDCASWPAFEDDEVPGVNWETEARHYVIQRMVRLITKDGHNIYMHCTGGNGRTGLFAAIVLLEVTGAYWLDVLKIVRKARPGSLSKPGQVLYLERYWRRYTARHMPINNLSLGDWSNWNTGIPKEMGDSAWVMPWGKNGANRNRDAASLSEKVLLKQELRREMDEMKHVTTLVPIKDVEDGETKLHWAHVIMIIMCTCIIGLLGGLLLPFARGSPLMDDEASPSKPLNVSDAEGIELSERQKK